MVISGHCLSIRPELNDEQLFNILRLVLKDQSSLLSRKTTELVARNDTKIQLAKGREMLAIPNIAHHVLESSFGSHPQVCCVH